MKNQTFKESVENKIKQSPSLIAALESVAAMYGIPAENIVVDDRLNSIQVQGDTILAPDKPNPSQNTQSIVCAIGAVLDYISQRIDKKLDAYQADNIAKAQEPVQPPVPAPSPADVPIEPDATSSTYFTDEDDVMKNVPTQVDIKQALAQAENNIPAQINESALMVDLVDRFHGTTTLGYDLLQHQGFDFVQPTNKIVQEADEGESSEASSSMKQIQHMKFDNSKILDAIKLFNDAYVESLKDGPIDEDENEKPKPKPEEKKPEPDSSDNKSDDKTDDKKGAVGDSGSNEKPSRVKVTRMMKTPEWKMGVKRLEEQFDCKLKINYNPEHETNMYTMINENQRREKLIISKSKGFQLSGMRINITIAGRMMDTFIKYRDKQLFGQSMVAVFLHEIFHNIVQMIAQFDFDFITSMSSTMMIATSTKSVKARRAIFSNYVKSIRSIDGKKLSLFERKKMIRQLLYISAAQYDANMINELKKQIDSGEASKDTIDKYIKTMEKAIEKEKKWRERRDKPLIKVLNAIMVIGGLLTMFVGVGFIILFAWSMLPISGMRQSDYEKWLKEYLNNPNKEEYYCDLFAGIYNLPVTFLLGSVSLTGGKTASRIDDPRLKKLASLEKEISQMIFSTYPTLEERCYASVKIAKKALEDNPDMDPSLKEYLQWIIDNYKNLEDIGIEDDYNAGAFNPKEADDLDEHIQRIIDHGDVTVTESAKPFQKKSKIGRFSNN